MNKLSLALALGTGLSLGIAAPARAVAIGTDGSTTTATVAPEIQTLSAGSMTASEFNTLFKPDTAVQTSTIDFAGAPGAGTISSQVFSGGTANGVDATGLYAYAYQVSMNNVTNASGEPVHVDGSSWQFNATPTGTNLTGTGTDFAYLVNGAVGGLGTPSTGTSSPTLSWQSGKNIGSILATYADGSSTANPLAAGSTSATFVVLSTQPPASNFQYAGVLSSDPQTSAPAVYSPAAGSISPIPIPEPATVLAWAGMAGAVLLVRRTRKARLA
jgi:hypothetical protein